MRYYRIIENGYISHIGTGPGGEEITKKEYNEILSVIQAKSEPVPGYRRRVKTDLSYEWEKVEEESPDGWTEIPDPGYEDEAADMKAALDVLGVTK